MSLSDIKLQLQELYGADVSESLISGITDDIIDFFGNYQLSRKSGKKLLKLGARDEI
jgi:hypothetical protein